ncbi:hypothetical protein N7E70_001405 [Aminobacter sp. NyZ550]|uniref:hypothetical protein n=1 Tax=Aminobacter sp. NyZ550 TaxID=2979870 RepID=UPI0022B223AE|nr:hypothetical protein [Aminobacter sp. NyZ550]WAX95573.1 hypothetical protein N7E70_001405 [Aminobacter sp. NyZ550]
MSKRDSGQNQDQLAFDQIWNESRCESINNSGVVPNNIVVFTDSLTIAVRKAAVDRVARSGIFAVPVSKRT